MRDYGSVMNHPVENILNPRAFIHASNEDALVLQSTQSESRLRFYNNRVSPNAISPGYVLSASNEYFTVSKDTNLIMSFGLNADDRIPQVSVPGRVSANKFEVSIRNDKKTIVIADYNYYSSNQFAGFGYIGGQLHYQVPSDLNIHRFMAAADAHTSYDLMRIQRSAAGVPQVGIGTTMFASTTTALHVAGNVVVQGDIAFNDAKYVRLNGDTGRIRQEQLPQNILLLNSNNYVDTSYLPQQFNFQYLRAGKNVGIGTKVPLQKLHINGSCYVTDRIGIGTAAPVSRVHVKETSSPIPSIRIDNSVEGGCIMEAYQQDNLIVSISSTVGIGTTITNGNMLKVVGNANVTGTISSDSVTATTMTANGAFTIPNVFYTEQVLNNTVYQTILRTKVPIVHDQRVTLKTILSPDGEVVFENTKIIVQGDIIHSGTITSTSDKRYKNDLKRIECALDKLDHMCGYTYALQNASRRTAGVVAQEVAEALPEAVETHPSLNDMLSVSYNGIVAMLVEGLKELRTEVQQIKRYIGM